MGKSSRESRINMLELHLEEAIQMLRLVAKNQRTCMEIEEWLKLNYPDDQSDRETVLDLIKSANHRTDGT